MARAGKSLPRSSGLRAAADDLGRGQKLRAAATQRAALAGALPENLLTRRRKQATLLKAASPRCVRFVAMGQERTLSDAASRTNLRYKKAPSLRGHDVTSHVQCTAVNSSTVRLSVNLNK